MKGWVILRAVPAERVSVYEGRRPRMRWERHPHFGVFATTIEAMRAFIDPLYESHHMDDAWIRRTWRGPCRVLHSVKLSLNTTENQMRQRRLPTPKPLPDEPQRWTHAILDLVGWIHGSITGTGDTYNPQRLAEWATWLQWRVTAGWEPSMLSRSAAYDEAVRQLARACLKEYYAWREELNRD